MLSIPGPVLDAGRQGKIDLTPFNSLIGPIPSNRLPSNQAFWPDPYFIEQFNKGFID
jgi:hypothetical protein